MFLLSCWLFVLTVEMALGNPLAGLDREEQHPTQRLWIVEASRDQLEPRMRVRRQLGGNYGSDAGSQVINDIFQIPIQTLTAVSNLFRSTRAQRNQRRRNTNTNNNNNNNNADSSGGYTAYSSNNVYSSKPSAYSSNNAYNSKPSAYSSNNNNAYSSKPNAYSSNNAYNSKPNVYYTTDSNGQNDGYSDVYSRPNRYTSSNGYNRPYNYFYQHSNPNRYSRKSAAETARLTVAKDGSSFKI